MTRAEYLKAQPGHERQLVAAYVQSVAPLFNIWKYGGKYVALAQWSSWGTRMRPYASGDTVGEVLARLPPWDDLLKEWLSRGLIESTEIQLVKENYHGYNILSARFLGKQAFVITPVLPIAEGLVASRRDGGLITTESLQQSIDEIDTLGNCASFREFVIASTRRRKPAP
jgi:hypothetical protein